MSLVKLWINTNIRLSWTHSQNRCICHTSAFNSNCCSSWSLHTCYFDYPVNGAWSAWSSWSGCSKICGPGLSKRQRTCTNPTPADNGHGCTGNSIDTQQCETRSCSGILKSKLASHEHAHALSSVLYTNNTFFR